MKTIVVTGGAGFIGSHLCEALLKEGNKVICIDNFVTGSKENIAPFLKNQDFSLIEHDITQPLRVEGKVDQVYNMASPASPVDFPRIPIEILLTGSLGLKNVLDLATEKRARVLQASTSEVYGQPLEHPQKESYWGNVNSIGERSCYDESKRFAEAMIMAYQRKKDLETRIVRIFNTYGPRMRPCDGRVIPNFVMQALSGKDLTIYGDGNQTRSFCFVSDLVEGIIKLMNSDYALPVNLGNPKEMTVKELAEALIKIVGSESKLVSKELPKDDPSKRRPDIGVAKQQLGWEPKVSLEAGLGETIEWFKKNQGE